MIKYSEQWDAYYDESTNEWTESKCDDPTCEYCVGRPEKPMVNQKLRELMIEAGYAAPEMAGRARKLADLLIRETAHIVETRDPRFEPIDHIYILKYFGVRE